MRKLRLVKVVIPEVVAVKYFPGLEEPLPDYRCTECGMGVAEDYLFCPYCGSELNFKKMDKKSREFLKEIYKTYGNDNKNNKKKDI